MEIENENKSSMFVNIVSVASIAAAVALSYLTFANWQTTYQISKAKFICTKIEQVGKNLDEVRCVQYTEQKFSKEAVALNQMMSK
jgi:Tfp pilus assembly protein PilN